MNKYASYQGVKMITDTVNSFVSDNRYKNTPADGRFLTDYTPHCRTNIAPEQQIPTILWLQHNGNNIIEKQRMKHTSFDTSIIPPPISIVKCSKSSCSLEKGKKGGIGIERREPVPELFGTYYNPYKKDNDIQAISITNHSEGGRNSLR